MGNRSAIDIIEATVGVKEKGYVNDPSDSGGETNWGITKKTAEKYKRLWAAHNWNGNMKTMPLSFAYDVYLVGYWNEQSLDLILPINDILAEKLFDIGVNYSTYYAQEWLQRILNVMNNRGSYYEDLVVDGDIGSATRDALQAYVNKRGEEGLAVLITGLNCFQGMHYITLSEKREKDEKWTYGWMRARVTEDLRAMFLTM